MGTGASQAWINSAEIAGESVLLARIYYGPGTGYIGAATGPVFTERKDNGEPKYTQEFDGDQYPAIIVAPLPVATNGNDIRTGKIQTDNIVLNVDGFSEIMTDSSFGSGNDFGFENREVEIVQWVPGITTWAGCAPFKKGIMRGFVQKGTVVSIKIQGRKSILNIKIPTELVTSADAADISQGLPEDSRGKVKPRIIGDHTYNKGNDSKALDTASESNSLVECIYLGIDSSNDLRWLVSEHELNEVDVTSEQEQFWVIDPNLKRAVRLTGVTVVKNDSSGCVIKHPSNPTLIDYVFAVDSTAGKSGAGVTYPQPTASVHDKDFTTKATGTMDNSAAQVSVGDWTQIFTTNWREWENQDIAAADVASVNLLYYGKLTYSGGATGADIKIRMGIDGAVWTDQTTEPSGASYPDARIENDVVFLTADKTGISENEGIRLEAVTNFTGLEKVTFEIYQMYKQVKYVLNTNPSAVLFAGKGAEYSFGRPGHAEGTAAGILAKNAAGVAESIVRDDLAYTDIDTDGFDTASGLVDVDLAFDLSKQSPAFNTLAAIQYQSRSLIHFKAGGDMTMTVIKKTYSESDYVVDYEALINPKFTISNLEDIVTKSLVTFRGSSGALTDQTAEVEDSVMRDKYKVTAAQSFLQFPATLVENNASGVNLNNWLLDFWKQPHRFGTFGAGLEYSMMDVGDVIQFINVPRKQLGLDITIDNTIAGQKIYKYFLIVDVSRSVNSVAFEVVQLHEVVY